MQNKKYTTNGLIIVTSFILLLIFVLGVTQNIYAHPGNTAGDGCHYCRTNCSKWGVTHGARHCHQNKGLPQPHEPIRSHKDGTVEIWEPYKKPKYSASKNISTKTNYESRALLIKQYKKELAELLRLLEQLSGN